MTESNRREEGRLAGAAKSADEEPISRRRVLGKALGAAAVGVAGAGLMDRSSAAASNGSNLVAGQTTTSESGTTVTYDGVGNLQGVVLLGNASTFSNAAASFPAALGGWGGAHAPNGIYGYTNVTGARAVIAIDHGGTGGAALYASSDANAAVDAHTLSSAGSAVAVRGVVESTAPGSFSAAVRGTNNGTGGLGIGVWGSQAGSGWGVYATSGSGIGVNASGGTGTGVSAVGGTGVEAIGASTGVSASGVVAVDAASTAPAGIAVRASAASTLAAAQATNTGSGPGITGRSATGRGAVLAGGAAQLRLTPGSRASHPKGGARGDLYADSNGRLWFCKVGGSTATWKQIA